MALQIGDKLDGFGSLKGVDGKDYELSSFDNKILVIIFSCNHCPYVKAYEDRYKELQSDYADKGVQVIAINSNDSVKYPEDNYENMKIRHANLGYNFPYLYDEDQSVAKKCGATNTPHVFVLNEDRILIYSGRIDDSWDDPSYVQKRDLRDALEAQLSGKAVEETSTLAVGCTIKWK